MKKTILVIGSHAGDIESRMGGTLARYIANGYQGCYVVMSNSSSGRWLDENGREQRRYSEEMRPIRQKQIENAAACFGLKPLILGYKELSYTTKTGDVVYADVKTRKFNPEPEGRPPLALISQLVNLGSMDPKQDYSVYFKEMVELISEWEPEITIMQEHDLDPDHCATFLFVRRAFIQAAKKVDLGELLVSKMHVLPGPYLNQQTDVSAAHKIVDITGCLSVLEKALDCFKPERAVCADTIEHILAARRIWGPHLPGKRGEAGEQLARILNGHQIRTCGIS